MKKSTLMTLLLLPAVLITPASANWFSRPDAGINLNVGSAPNPTPDDLRALRGADTGIWQINAAESKFGPRLNTLVVEWTRQGAQAATQDSGATAGTFLVISEGKAYLATAAADASSGGTKAIDYGAWRGMKLVQIGSNVQAINDCGSRCQYGLPGNRMTVTFRSFGTGGEPIGSILALNRR